MGSRLLLGTATRADILTMHETADTNVAWVVVDVQEGFRTDESVALASRIRDAVMAEPGPVFAVVQVNPVRGPLRMHRRWDGCSAPEDARLLSPLGTLAMSVHPKTGYGAVSSLPFDRLREFDRVMVCGLDTDGCVLAVTLRLFDESVPVVCRTDLCVSSGGNEMHALGVRVLTRMLGKHNIHDEGT